MVALRSVATEHEIRIGWKKIDIHDLSGVKIRLKSLNNWTEEKCDRIEIQYKAFLKLHLQHHSNILVPTQDIDDMWHAHILHTRMYVNFCQNVFGCYLHHNPHSVEVPDEKSRHTAFLETKELLMEVLRQNETQMNGQMDAAICDGGAYCDGGASCDAAPGSGEWQDKKSTFLVRFFVKILAPIHGAFLL